MSAFRYTGFGLRIDSALELPDLVAAAPGAGGPDVVIRTGAVDRDRRRITLDEELAVNVVGAAFLIRRGCEIIVDAKAGAEPESVRAVLLGKVMAFLLRQRGWLPLHASCIVIDGGSVLFAGDSGAGKSTIAAAFYRAGHLVISDDVGAVRRDAGGNCLVQTAWPHVRLLEDARAVLGYREFDSRLHIDKYRYNLEHGVLQDLYSVRCICVLEYGETIALRRLSPLQAIAQLSKHSFVRHRNLERGALGAHFCDCASVAGATPVYRLVRPQSLDALPEVVRFVEDELRRV